MTAVGFTGSSQGVSPEQFNWLRDQLVRLGATELHHGDCVGGDHAAHEVALELKLRVVIHPPVNASRRAWCTGDEVRPAREYLDRNRDIVDETEVLLALPDGPERLRSGTWATIRYARRIGRPVEVELP